MFLQLEVILFSRIYLEEITVKFYENYSPSRAQRMTQVRAPKNDEIFF